MWISNWHRLQNSVDTRGRAWVCVLGPGAALGPMDKSFDLFPHLQNEGTRLCHQPKDHLVVVIIIIIIILMLVFH